MNSSEWNFDALSDDDIKKECSFYLKTVQSTTFKVLFDALKEILTETNLIFDQSGIQVKALDETHNVYVHVRLNSDSFERFVCNSGRYINGVAIINLYKLLKTMTSNDVLTIFQSKQDTDRLGIRIENSQKACVTRQFVTLLDIPEIILQNNNPEYDFRITMDSSQFQKIVRDMKDIATNVTIRSHNSQLMFACKGDFAERETYLGVSNTEEGTEGISYSKTDNKTKGMVVQGKYPLHFLHMFTKNTPLSKKVVLHLRNDYPLTVMYPINELGYIKMALSFVEAEYE